MHSSRVLNLFFSPLFALIAAPKSISNCNAEVFMSNKVRYQRRNDQVRNPSQKVDYYPFTLSTTSRLKSVIRVVPIMAKVPPAAASNVAWLGYSTPPVPILLPASFFTDQIFVHLASRRVFFMAYSQREFRLTKTLSDNSQ